MAHGLFSFPSQDPCSDFIAFELTIVLISADYTEQDLQKLARGRLQLDLGPIGDLALLRESRSRRLTNGSGNKDLVY
jgi:hypothetical protein